MAPIPSITPQEGISSEVCHRRQDFAKVGQRTPVMHRDPVYNDPLIPTGLCKVPEGKVGGLQARVGADSILGA